MNFHPEEGELVAYLDDELSARSRWKLRLHLLFCKTCCNTLGEFAEGLLYFSSVETESCDNALQSIRSHLLEFLSSSENAAPAPDVLSHPQAVREIAAFVGARAEAGSVGDVLRTFLGQQASDLLRHRFLKEVTE